MEGLDLSEEWMGGRGGQEWEKGKGTIVGM